MPIIAGLFYGIKPAVVAIVFHATYRIGSRSLKNKFLWGIAALAFIAIFAFNLPFPLIVFAAAAIGYFASKKYPTLFAGGGSHQQSKKDYGPLSSMMIHLHQHMLFLAGTSWENNFNRCSFMVLPQSRSKLTLGWIIRIPKWHGYLYQSNS